MKSEFLYIKEFENVEHFKIELEIYIDYYNTKRIKANFKVPNEITVSNYEGSLQCMVTSHSLKVLPTLKIVGMKDISNPLKGKRIHFKTIE